MTVSQSHISLEYLRYPVRAIVRGIIIDPTPDVVQFAFPSRAATPTVFYSGGWETTVDGTHLAHVLVGPGGIVTLTAGIYDVWIKITDSPEVPARKIDSLIIT